MEDNPYKAPPSSLRSCAKFKRSVWWKIYFFLITSLSGLGFASLFADPKAAPPEWINLLFFLVATVGLFGFAFHKSIYKPLFWRAFFFTYFAYSALYFFITGIDQRHGLSDSVFYATNAIVWLISLPAYYGLYTFSKNNNPLWKPA